MVSCKKSLKISWNLFWFFGRFQGHPHNGCVMFNVLSYLLPTSVKGLFLLIKISGAAKPHESWNLTCPDLSNIGVSSPYISKFNVFFLIPTVSADWVAQIHPPLVPPGGNGRAEQRMVETKSDLKINFLLHHHKGQWANKMIALKVLVEPWMNLLVKRSAWQF